MCGKLGDFNLFVVRGIRLINFTFLCSLFWRDFGRGGFVKVRGKFGFTFSGIMCLVSHQEGSQGTLRGGTIGSPFLT